MADLAQVRRIAWEPGHVLDMMPSVNVSPWGPLEGPNDVLGGSMLYEITEGNGRALVAVRPVQLEMGKRLDVVGLVSTGDRLSAATVARALDDMAANHSADQLALWSQIPHVIKGAGRNGWNISGVVLTKGFHRVKQ